MDKAAVLPTRCIGVDVGASAAKAVLIERNPPEPWGDGEIAVASRCTTVHQKDPRRAVSEALTSMETFGASAIAATGRLARVLATAQVPTKAALRLGARFVHPELPSVTVLSIGAHGFSVLELHEGGEESYRQNSRCSQGTGNFLAQLVERFGVTVEEASALADAETVSAPLSGRCPVILKTDMTHLANKGEKQSRILAGLYDAVCENVITLLRPRLAPRDVVLIGGVANAARVRRNLRAWLAERGMHLCEPRPADRYLEAIGAALHALEMPEARRSWVGVSDPSLFTKAGGPALERVPSLRDSLALVHRLTAPPAPAVDRKMNVVLGLDIGSTGSKAVAIDPSSGQAVWEAYLNTEGAPVRAAQSLFSRFVGERGANASIARCGVTGSGREIVGSVLRSCYGADRIVVMNEIAAHARGAVKLDPEVDTIFEIGGQDAKYIRLEGGRVVDAAMNEACSAGTGSFIAEQGGKFEGIGRDVERLAAMALSAEQGVSLGQHCSVFMAEVIDEAISQGIGDAAIVAGLYDSVIQNYLNRVKGPRSVGSKVFCQGMPFRSDALAAAVARQTGRPIVVPPNPGTIGAFGIALLASEAEASGLLTEAPTTQANLDPALFLGAEVSSKETFVCSSTKGCGGSGNRCRVDRLTTRVGGHEAKFVWGGNCSLYDRGAVRAKLPDRAPDPFREREALIDALVASQAEGVSEGPVLGLADEFAARSLTPLFVVFLRALGVRVKVLRQFGAKALRKGIEGARVPFCAPMQMLHGAAFELAESGVDAIFLPMIKDLPRVAGEDDGQLCPVVLGSPDLVAGVLSEDVRVERPVIEFGRGGLGGEVFRRSMRAWAESLGRADAFEGALARAVEAQVRFEAECLDIGRRALEFSEREGVVPVAVLGRPYTIYNDVLNSNVPSILRGLGALAIPVDCVPISEEARVFNGQYWGHTQRNLRVAEHVRQTPGLYSVFCSNYACGPDSFTLHFYAYIMQNKPFAIVETDGHSGDAGTKTRMEAFLYCVDADRRSGASLRAPRADFGALDGRGLGMAQSRRERRRMLIPRMGPAARVAVAALVGDGHDAEVLPVSTSEDVRTGRRHTSGKECVPMMLTIGTILNRLESERDTATQFTVFMPTARGPCRFGVYNSLYKIVLEKTGWAERVEVVSPDDGDYFREMSSTFTARLWLGFCAHDFLESMLRDVRPVERVPGGAQLVYERAFDEVVRILEQPAPDGALSLVRELLGGMWGVRRVVQRAADEFSALRDRGRDVPTVAVVGEIYARLDPFANDFVVERLERKGIRARLAPFIEWLEYTNALAEERIRSGRPDKGDDPLGIALRGALSRGTLEALHAICARALGWGPRSTVEQALRTAAPYVHPELTGEAGLTVGGPLHEFGEGLVEGVVIVGPHECMPCKIAEAQYGKAAESVDVPYLSIALNGDPVDSELIDRFAFDIHERFRSRAGGGTSTRPAVSASGWYSNALAEEPETPARVTATE